MRDLLKTLSIDQYAITPYYTQIYNSISSAVKQKLVDKNELLPSIHDLSVALNLSRNTIARAYNELKEKGIINSVPGKGYFISTGSAGQSVKVLLLFNKLSDHKEVMYDAFTQALSTKASIDFYIYNSNFDLFRKLLIEKADNYDKIVIVPHFRDNANHASEVINHIPKEKLILMGSLADGITGEFGAVYEDFSNDIYNALTNLTDNTRHYTSLTIIFPEKNSLSGGILTGFVNYCHVYKRNFNIMSELHSCPLQRNTLYITLTEDDLIQLIDNARSLNYEVGEDIGIISYNETIVKRVILNGITTFSTDFGFMGEKAAELVLNNSTRHFKVPFRTIVRPSI